MSQSAPLREQQRAFAAYIRDPGAHPAPPDIEARRMAIYRRLFFNSTVKFLDNCFRVIRRILPKAHWQAITEDFFAHHRCRSPIFADIPREFVDYLRTERTPAPEDPPFLAELAHYEWVELALTLAEDPPADEALDSAGDLLGGVPVWSSTAWPLFYNWPVHRIGPDFKPGPGDTEPTFLVVWRDRRDQVRFMTLTTATARLVELINENRNQSGDALLQVLSKEAGHPDPDAFRRFGRDILEKFRANDMVLGARPIAREEVSNE